LRGCVGTNRSNVYGKIQKEDEKKEARDTENTKENGRNSTLGGIKNKVAGIRRQETRMNDKGRAKQINCEI
jgi:hypothetical protein